MLEIRESVEAGTYRVAPEAVAAAIMAGPFATPMSAELSLADRIARLTKPPQRDNHK